MSSASTRGSFKRIALLISSCISVSVRNVKSSKQKSLKRQPNSGCITRSPGYVIKRMRRLSSMSISCSDIFADPVSENATGNDQPRPKNELSNVLASNHHCRAPQNNRAAMSCSIAHACRRFTTNHHRRRALYNRIGRPNANTCIAHHRSRHATNQYRWSSRPHYRSAHMRNRRRNRRRLHGTCMHIGHSCCTSHKNS